MSRYRLGLASYIYSLDGQTTYTYLAYATSTFSEHSLISSIQVAEGIISKQPLRSPIVFAHACFSRRWQAFYR